MSFIGKVVRTVGLYDSLKQHFFDVIQAVDESGGVAEIVKSFWVLQELPSE